MGCTRRQRWANVSGPVSAAYAHLEEIEAEWKTPFKVRILDRDVCLISTPPKQINKLLQEHARLHLDNKLIVKIAMSTGVDIDKVLHRYRHGIDWELIRCTLRNHDGDLEKLEIRGLEIITTLAYWSEERRWLAGMLGEASCRTCHSAIGNNPHHFHYCDGAIQHFNWQRAQGRLRRESKCIEEDGLAPLEWHGLPPRESCWQPVDGRSRQTSSSGWSTGKYYGDGSGTAQNDRDRRRATSALWWPGENSIDPNGGHYTRRAVTGWFPTSTRGEITAAIDFLDNAPTGSIFIGDCKYVIDNLQSNIPWKARSSSSIDADLWRIAKRALTSKNGKFSFIKIKAHRSRQSAETNGQEGIEEWEGNGQADALARNLCKTLQASVDASGNERREQYQAVLQRMAAAAGWTLRHRPDVVCKVRRRGGGTSTTTQTASGTIGPHPMKILRTGGLECTKCRLRASTAATIRSLRIKPCLGSVMDQCHASHQMRWSAGVAWCCSCGKYTSRIPTSLRLECPRRPQSDGARNILHRLRRGLPPTTAAHLAVVAEEAKMDDATDMSADRGQALYEDRSASTRTSRASEAAPSSDTLSEPRQPVHSHPRSSSGAQQEPVYNHLTDLDIEEGLCPRPRYRLTGKQRPSDARILTATSSATDPAPWCRQREIPGAWSRRLSIQRLPISESCNGCKSLTRTRCSSCYSPLCLHCARNRRPCTPTGTARA